MGCGTSVTTDNKGRRLTTAMKAAILIQRWYRRYIARLEMRQRYTWNIFQSIEYAGEQDQLQLSSFFSFMLDNFTQLNGNGPDLISHLLDPVVDPWSDRERQTMFEQITVPESYSGPHLTFPLTVSHTNALLSAFKEQQPLHGRYMLQLLHQTKKLLKQMPNVIHLSTPYAKEITICGDLHGRLDDLLLIFYKNGLPSAETPYVFNGDFVDRGKKSVEVIILLFAYQLLYPDHMTLNRGNHEDHIMNLRYGFTKEVMQKYKTHGRDILLLVQDVFSLLPIATVIDNKVLIVHGGISDMTDLYLLSSIERHKVKSALRLPRRSLNHLEVTRSSRQGQPESPRCRSRGQPESPRCRSRGQPESPRCRSRGQPERPRCRSRGQPESPRCRSRGQDHGNTPKKRRHLTRQGSSSSSSSSSLCSPRGSSRLTLCRCLSPSMLSPTDNLQVPFLDSFTALPVRQPPREELEWKQVVDLLWSDPKSQPGCSPNTFRGGGSYFGPDVTRRLLERHGMTLLIRSHECKQEGYEVCHDGQVITIFSASNYYEEGSNRGAYIKLGRELVPRFFQYQVSRNTRKLTLTQRVNVAEGSAVRAVQEKLFSHRSELMAAFQQYDTSNSGCISVSEWALVVESVVRLDLPWRTLRPRLARLAPDGSIDYQSCFEDMGPGQPIPQVRTRKRLIDQLIDFIWQSIKLLHSQNLPLCFVQVTPNLAETLYRYRTDLEIIFNIMDKDHSGQISIEEFRQTWHLFSAHLGVEVDDRAIDELAKSIDFNKDGSIDFNEFLEAFRVVHKLDVKDQQQG
uniref:Serine/threonine-protein phosphatase n=1 Tax=Oncorhynchus mykiss TaxID=8022 RepID=A0A8K9XUY6_ONCMY